MLLRASRDSGRLGVFIFSILLIILLTVLKFLLFSTRYIYQSAFHICESNDCQVDNLISYDVVIDYNTQPKCSHVQYFLLTLTSLIIALYYYIFSFLLFLLVSYFCCAFFRWVPHLAWERDGCVKTSFFSMTMQVIVWIFPHKVSGWGFKQQILWLCF